MKYTVVRTAFREGQYEFISDIRSDSGDFIIGNLIVPSGPKLLEGAERDKLFETAVFPFINQEPEAPPKTYTAEEVTQILRDKNYLTGEQEFSEDLEPKEAAPVIPK